MSVRNASVRNVRKASETSELELSEMSDSPYRGSDGIRIRTFGIGQKENPSPWAGHFPAVPGRGRRGRLLRNDGVWRFSGLDQK